MSNSSRRAAFVDRDGVINAELGYVGHAKDFQLLPHAVDGLRQFATHGYALVVVTNQAGIAKGLYSEDDYQRVTRYMTELLMAQQVRLDGVYHCPHHPEGMIDPFAVACTCRKPAPGMLLRAAAELQLDLSSSVLVGDKLSDIKAGRAAGVRWAILVRSGHALPEMTSRDTDCICEDLAAAATWVCSRTETGR